MSALPVTLATGASGASSTGAAYTLDTLCDALVDRNILLDGRAARAGRLHYTAPAGAMTPDIRAALALHKRELLAALTATPPPMRKVSVCAWGAPHFQAWRYHAGERRLVCAICYPDAWRTEKPEKPESTPMDTTPHPTPATRADAPEATPEAPPEAPPEGGAMMRLERDADGYVHAVPDTVTYFEATGAPAGASSTGDARASSPTGDAAGWRIWRATDREPGDAPAFASFDRIGRALWFGEALADDLDACSAAWARLCGWIVREYPGCHAMRTPGATGLQLIAHTLPWGKGQKRPYRYPTLAPELARLLAATAPQHRMELLTAPGLTMRRYTVYDARVAHAAYLRHLPVIVGEDASSLIHDEGEYIPYRAGKYRVTLTVPRGWAHVGLVHRAASGGYGWDYPATPGTEWETWLDESEVRLLANNPLMPWPFTVRERIMFDDPKTAGSDPLREHAARITGYLENIERERRNMAHAAHGGATPATAQQAQQAREALALRNAARAVALHPIGLWHKRDNQHTRTIASLDDLTPEDADATITPTGEGGYTVTTSGELSAYQAHWRRVEWSITVYARERVTATRKALEAPRASVLAVRGDALHLADYAPDAWAHDTGKVGAYRIKADVTYPRARRAPRTDAELLALASASEK